MIGVLARSDSNVITLVTSLQNPQGFTTRLKLTFLDYVVVWEWNKGLGQNKTPLPHSICFN
jgi:hypothetical protein